MLPGIVLIIWGSWWAYNICLRYLASRQVPATATSCRTHTYPSEHEQGLCRIAITGDISICTDIMDDMLMSWQSTTLRLRNPLGQACRLASAISCVSQSHGRVAVRC